METRKEEKDSHPNITHCFMRFLNDDLSKVGFLQPFGLVSHDR